MEFQFPANPQAGDSVQNVSTGVNYVWTVPPGQWRVKNIAKSNVGVYEGSSEPPAGSEYSLWFNTLTQTLHYYYCPPNGTCEWVSTAFTGGSDGTLLETIQTLSDVIIELQTKVNVLNNTAFLLME